MNLSDLETIILSEECIRHELLIMKQGLLEVKKESVNMKNANFLLRTEGLEMTD